jgi:hypothetical protein
VERRVRVGLNGIQGPAAAKHGALLLRRVHHPPRFGLVATLAKAKAVLQKATRANLVVKTPSPYPVAAAAQV